MAAIGSDGRVASMLVALLLGSCCVGHGSGDEAHVGCIESERRALLAIKSDMHGPDDRFSSWTDEDCCGWRGVACNDTTGHVNPSLQRLKHLKYLNLSMISSLVHLEYLNLSHAMFDGSIPLRFETLGMEKQEKNRILQCNDANLPSVPSPLPPFNLTAMARLDLSKNYNIMVTMLRWLSNATSLEYLDLSGCGINLKGLDLSSNSLEGDILGILSNVSGGGLKHLDLSQNYFYRNHHTNRAEP
ncbi:unnamed protein product [Musa hybrid cultivar]